jgi:hypothetical protein
MDIGMIIFDSWDKIRNTYILNIKNVENVENGYCSFVASFTKIVKKTPKNHKFGKEENSLLLKITGH